MAVPKRRQSNQKTRSRRAHDVLTPRQLTFCSNCGKAVPTHRICGTCGHYMGRAVVKAEDPRRRHPGSYGDAACDGDYVAGLGVVGFPCGE